MAVHTHTHTHTHTKSDSSSKEDKNRWNRWNRCWERVENLQNILKSAGYKGLWETERRNGRKHLEIRDDQMKRLLCNLDAHQNHLISTVSSRQQMHPQNTENILPGPDIRPRTVGESQAKASWIRNSAEEVGVAGPHTSPTTRWHSKSSPKLEPPGNQTPNNMEQKNPWTD